MGAPMTCESAVLVATMAKAGPVSWEEWNTVMCTHIPGKVPASTIPRISLCTHNDNSVSHTCDGVGHYACQVCKVRAEL